MLQPLGRRWFLDGRFGPRLQLTGREDPIDRDTDEVDRRTHQEHRSPFRYRLLVFILHSQIQMVWMANVLLNKNISKDFQNS